MRSVIPTTIGGLAAVTLGAAPFAPALAASADYYLKIGDIKGESATASGGHKGEIEILSWSWGASQALATGVTSPRDSASGLPTGKRQHGWVTVSRPLDRGSVRVKVKMPWLDCKAGAAFPDAVLQNDAGRYELKDVVISSCSAGPSASGDGQPAETITLNYSKVQVRGWDPKKKEE